jgi:hypothetical protein
MGSVPPIADPYDHIRPKPSVIPFLFLCRFEVYREYFDPHFLKPFVKQLALSSKSPW